MIFDCVTGKQVGGKEQKLFSGRFEDWPIGIYQSQNYPEYIIIMDSNTCNPKLKTFEVYED